MEYVHVFGLRLGVDPKDHTLQFPRTPAHFLAAQSKPSLFLYKERDKRELDFQSTLIIGNQHTVQIHARLQLEERSTGSGEWYVSDGQHRQPKPDAKTPSFTVRVVQGIHSANLSAGDVLLKSGDLLFESLAIQNATPLVKDKGPVQFQLGSHPWVLSLPELPLVLESQPEGTFSIDLGKAELTFHPKAFVLKSKVQLQQNGHDLDLFTVPHDSVAATFRLTSSITSPGLAFVPANKETPLPLHADLLHGERAFAQDNPVMVPLGAVGYQLELNFVKHPSGTSRLAGLGLKAADTAKGFTLITYNYATHANEPAEWRGATRLELAMRALLPGDNRPAALLVDTRYGAPGKVSSPDKPLYPLRPRASGPLHGVLRHGRFVPRGEVRLRCDRSIAQVTSNAGIKKAIDTDRLLRLFTVPWLDISAPNGDAGFDYGKPGHAYVTPGAAQTLSPVETYAFRGKRLGLPLLSHELRPPPQNVPAALAELLTLVNGDLQKAMLDQRYVLEETQHESWLRERPKTAGDAVAVAKLLDITRPLEVKPSSRPLDRELQEVAASLQAAKHKIIRDYGPVTVELTLPSTKPLDYVAIRENDKDSLLRLEKLIELVEGSLDFVVDAAQRPASLAQGQPMAILKLSSRFTLEEIFNREGIEADLELPSFPGKRLFTHVLDGTVKQREWTGLILFNIGVQNQEKDSILSALLPKELRLAYLAITPAKPRDLNQPGKDTRFSLSGRVLWRNNEPLPSRSTPAMDTETLFRVTEVDAAWYDRQMVFFHAETETQFHSFFGLNHEVGFAPSVTGPPTLKVIGSFDQKKKEIRFVGSLDRPVALLKDVGFGPIKQAYIKGAEIRSVQGEVGLSIDGRLELQAFPADHFDLQETVLDFTGLRIRLGLTGVPLETKGGWFSIAYPSLELRFTKPLFRLGWLGLTLTGIGVNWSGLDDLEPGLLVKQYAHAAGNAALSLGFRMEMMKLPDLSFNPFGRLSFDLRFLIGQESGRWSASRMRVLFRGAAVDDLRLDLLRFLQVRAERVELDSDQGLTWVKFINVSVRILDKPIVNGLTLLLFSSKERQGFIAFLPTNTIKPQLPLIQLRWVLVAHNASFDEELVKHIVAIEPPLGKVRDVRLKIAEAARTRDIIKPMSESATHGKWLFGAEFDVASGFLQGKFLFQDGRYYGISIKGDLFDSLFGSGFGISVVYIKADRPEQDSFVISVSAPKVTTGAFQFTGGVITLEISLSGNFTLDVGFPWLAGATRQWNRALGAIITPFQGSGGFYIRKHALGPMTEFQRIVELGGGYAVQAGLGVAGGSGPFHVWATIGLYSIFEGKVHLAKAGRLQITGLKVVGAVGIVGRAGGELNWWIISVRVEVLVSSEARATIEWGTCRSLPASDAPISTGDPVQVEFAFDVYASVRARACIGRGWFKLCKSISVSVSLPIRHTVTL